jgi:hypothetical protein
MFEFMADSLSVSRSVYPKHEKAVSLNGPSYSISLSVIIILSSLIKHEKLMKMDTIY